VYKVRREFRVFKVSKVLPDQRVCKDHRAIRVYRDLRDWWVRKENEV
jgi:hypothetical protein